MKTIAIIDDEPRARDFLRSLIEEHFNWLNVVGEADSVTSGLQLIGEKAPDILLLDVEMQDGTGFDLMDRIDDDFLQVIFITAYDHYAVNAIRSNALDYIEKPVNPAELTTALMRAKSILDKQGFKTPQRTPEEPVKSRIAVPTKLGLKYIDIDTIRYVAADGSYSEFFLLGQEKPLVISRKLKEVQTTLEPMGFVRANHSNLVNIQMVEELRKTDGGSLVLKGGDIILLSKHYKEESLSRLARFSKNLG